MDQNLSNNNPAPANPAGSPPVAPPNPAANPSINNVVMPPSVEAASAAPAGNAPSSSGPKVPKKVIFAIAGVIVILVGTIVGVALVKQQQQLQERAAQVSPIDCPIPPAENRIIVKFNGEFIVSDNEESDAMLGPENVSVPAGTYDITLVSYEKDHPTVPTQPNESWYLKLNNANGSTFAQTNAIGDMPDDQSIMQQVVNQDFVVAEDISSVTAYHAAFQDYTSPNSINPVCAVFESLSIATPTPTPSEQPTPTPSAEPGKASVGDFVWIDTDGDGVQDSGETGLSGAVVKLYSGNTEIDSTTTNSSGFYSFVNLDPGSYTIEFVLPSGYTRSPANQGGNDQKDSDANATTGKTGTITLAAGEEDLTWDAGFVPTGTGGNSPTPSATPTATPTTNPTATPTVTPTATPTDPPTGGNPTPTPKTPSPTPAGSSAASATPIGLPNAGTTFPTVLGIGFGVILLLGALVLAL